MNKLVLHFTMGALVLASLAALAGCEPTSSVESITEVKTASPAEQSSRMVMMAGSPHPVVGRQVKAGDVAPDAVLVANDLSTVRLSSYRGKVLVLAAVPSLDTGVCSAETRRFNELAGQLGDGVRVLTISMDLPFAQNRWCAAEGIENVQTLSDHRQASFGQEYGVLMPDVRLLARAVFVVDKSGRLRYVHRLGDLAKEPDYAEVLAAVKKLQRE